MAPSTPHFIWPHPACQTLKELTQNCDFQRTRRGGPGGQHRNKVETAVVVTHRPTGTIGQASEKRSQQSNREVALFRLRLNLALALRLERPLPTNTSESWRSRLVGRAIRINPQHDDFPSLLAEALDRVHDVNFDIGEASKLLACSNSQLVKFFKLYAPAIALVNSWRQQIGLSPFR